MEDEAVILFLFLQANIRMFMAQVCNSIKFVAGF